MIPLNFDGGKIMKNKLFFGIILILIGLYQIFGKFIDLNSLEFIFNYQFILILVGIYLLFKNKGQSVAGVLLIALAAYLYLKDFVKPIYLELVSSILIILVGGSLIYFSSKDKNKKS